MHPVSLLASGLAIAADFSPRHGPIQKDFTKIRSLASVWGQIAHFIVADAA